MKHADGTMDFAPDPNARLSRALNRLIDEALEAENAQQTPRDYLGGSRLGEECLRRLAYDMQDDRRTLEQIAALKKLEGGADDVSVYLARRGSAFEGKALRRFAIGHWHEDETARWLRLAGFDLKTHGRDGRQFGFSVLGPETGATNSAHGGKEHHHLKGHIDGALVDGPAELGGVALPYPLLWEHKIMKAKKWTEFANKGVAVSHPHYVAQCQVYMLQMELGACLFTGLNTDTSEIRCELLTLDPEAATRYVARGMSVLEAERPEALPRITMVPEDYRCKFCRWQKECWAAVATPAPAPAAQPDQPAWLNPNGWEQKA